MPRTPRFPLAPLAAWCLLALTAFADRAAAQASHVAGEILVRGRTHGSRAFLTDFAGTGLVTLEIDAVSGVLRLGVPIGSEDTWIQILSAHPDVKYAERNGIGHGGATTPDDSWFGQAWHLENTGQNGGTVGADINATTAWDLTTGSPNVVIAVLDSGIDTAHPEFAGRIDLDGRDFVNDDPDPEADHPHGTWVTATLAANSDNGFGVSGVDWQCKILPIKVLDATNSGTTFDLAQGLNYVATQTDVSVVSMSLINYPGSQTLLDALEVAADAGKILVSCAGNGGPGNADTSYPGASPRTISIGATTRNDARASFSATGSALDFVAPGASIATAVDGSLADTFTVVSGCSFATPITSGVVGLLIARAEALGLGSLDQATVYDILRASAADGVGPASEDSAGRDDFFGHGRIDARAALDQLGRFTCRSGTVATGLVPGVPPEDVLFVNGSSGDQLARRVLVGTGEPIAISVLAPTTNQPPSAIPPDFVIWGQLGDPAFSDLLAFPGLGSFCFAPFDIAPRPEAFTFASSLPIGSAVPAMTAPWSLPLGALGFSLEFTLQGVILDDPLGRLALTNAVTIDIRPLPAPTVASVDVPLGTPGATRTLTGTGFRPGLSLDLDGTPLPPPLSVEPDTVLFAEPTSIPCDATLTVTNPDGQTAGVPFNPSPTISSLATPQGTPASGGVFCVVQGTGFVPGTTVTLAGTVVVPSSLSPTTMLITTPPGPVGPASLVVTTPTGCTASTTYTYTP
jgi:subtilisin family serine protease